MELVVLRHGEAGRRVALASDDAERGLTVAGKDEVKDVAQAMKRLDLEFDVIATSPLRRARETAEIVAKELGLDKTLRIWDELKPEADSKILYRRLSRLNQDSCVLMVGHEPFLSTMIGEMITGGRGCHIVLKKSGIAKLEISSFTPAPTAELRWLLTPRVAKRLS